MRDAGLPALILCLTLSMACSSGADGGDSESIGEEMDETEFAAEGSSTQITWNAKPANLVVVRDITDRLASEAALKESEERSRTLIEHAPEAIT